MNKKAGRGARKEGHKKEKRFLRIQTRRGHRERVRNGLLDRRVRKETQMRPGKNEPRFAEGQGKERNVEGQEKAQPDQWVLFTMPVPTRKKGREGRLFPHHAYR